MEFYQRKSPWQSLIDIIPLLIGEIILISAFLVVDVVLLLLINHLLFHLCHSIEFYKYSRVYSIKR